MKFAAKLYATKYKLENTNLLLAATDVTSQPPRVQEFLELG